MQMFPRNGEKSQVPADSNPAGKNNTLSEAEHSSFGDEIFCHKALQDVKYSVTRGLFVNNA
jgi:hypothetical protein